MSNAPLIPTPAERLATVFVWILASARQGLLKNVRRLEGPVQVMLYKLAGDRIGQARDRLIRLAERLRAGWVYTPKPYAPRKPAAQPCRVPDPIASGSHWLLRAAPGPDSGSANAALYALLEEPAIAAVLAAAPGPAWRIVQPVCTMLGVAKPSVLAKLDRRPPRAPKPGKPLDHPPPPLPWEVLPPTPELPDYQPSFFWPWIGPKPKTA
jgi:hypothetical protein